MNFQNIAQNKYIQAIGGIFALAFVFWLASDFNTSDDIAVNVNTSDDNSETHKVSTSVSGEPLEILVEAKAPDHNEGDNENGSNVTGDN